MTRLSPLFRGIALLGAAWVQFVFVGPGLHDPDCVHHRPGASGEAHAHHGSHTDASAGDDGGSDPTEERPGSPGRQCSCLGVCVPGALAGVVVPQDGPDVTIPAGPALAGSTRAVPAATLPPLPTLLPPSTGPPRGA